jgi:signal transduction histidine kinase
MPPNASTWTWRRPNWKTETIDSTQPMLRDGDAVDSRIVRPGGARTAAPIDAGPAPRSRALHLRILAPFVVAMVALTLMTITGFDILSAVRAFVGGESLWSKGRSEAVQALKDFVVSGRPEDRQRFDAALAIAAGDHQARIELDKPNADLEVARDGFRRGGNHPQDIGGMIRLYRYFHSTYLMERAIAAWTEGDQRIDELRAIADRVGAQRASGRFREADAPAEMTRIDMLSARLAAVEKEFSASLGEASHRVERLLDGAIVVTTAVLVVAGLVFGRRTLARQTSTERQLEEANRRWKMAARAAGIGVFDWDVGTDVVTLDARARAIYGLGRDDGQAVSRADMSRAVHPDDEPLLGANAEEGATLSAGQMRKGRYRIVKGSGVRHVEAVGTAVDGGRGQRAVRFVGIVRDVTEEIEKVQLQVERDAAEQVARSRIEFLSRLSHELRTPLNAVLGFSQLLMTDKSDPPSAGQLKRLDMVVQGGTQLLKLAEDVLDISSVDSGAIDVRGEPVELQAQLTAALALVESERERMAVRVENRVPAAPIVVLGDPRRLVQVFSNLLSNGCKYNAKGGTLRIDAVALADSVQVSFTDQGGGMTREQVTELFQPFKRLPNHAAIAGTGMGLVVVRLLLAHMGGRVDVASEPGKGARFTVRLRRAPMLPAAPKSRPH